MLTEKQKERYSRQIISPLIGEKGQEKLSKVSVLQIGAGDLVRLVPYTLQQRE